ncbi:MAG: hypothetical protein AAFR23_01440 [Pseudomonadota bacterium]
MGNIKTIDIVVYMHKNTLQTTDSEHLAIRNNLQFLHILQVAAPAAQAPATSL